MFGSILFKIVRFFVKIWEQLIQILLSIMHFFYRNFSFCVDQINAKYIFELTFVGKRA